MGDPIAAARGWDRKLVETTNHGCQSDSLKNRLRIRRRGPKLSPNGRGLTRNQMELFIAMRSAGRVASFVLVCAALWVSAGLPVRTLAADPNAARQAFYSGDYEGCIEIASAEVERGVWNVFWAKQLIKAQLELGRYREAVTVYESVVEKFPSSLRLRMLAATAYRFSGDPARGQRLLDEIPYVVQSARWRFRDAENLMALGEFLLDEGEDAREVLAFYDSVLEQDPKAVEAHLATARLALQKSDFQEAAKSLDKAIELRPDDPEIHYLLARAWAPSEQQKAQSYLQSALKINAKHTPTLLELAERLVTSEQYEKANELLDKILAVNKSQPQAWAFKAAIAHLRGKYEDEAEFRSRGMSTWTVNPAVDHLIGKLLSQHYRFEESVKYQRRSLKYASDYLPAQFQLGQDLLRLGQTDEGWTLVDRVANSDEYNVVAYNLKTLRGRLNTFATLRKDGIILRMDPSESAIYGDRALDLLQQARKVLAEKYAVNLKLPVTVEIFPKQNDFAIRTFGLPGGDGFLGVCFGSLITANSPASLGDTPSNWESVLWHEFCHVVTLQKTNNKMPRWLSEGISVYEELERDPTWGQRLTPLYRSMLLGDSFVPLSQLSSAFMSPDSPIDLQFAYFESSLAVRYLIELHGLPRLQRLLVDLGVGLPAAEAFGRLYGDPDVLDAEFKQYVEELAGQFAANVSFDADAVPKGLSTDALAELVAEMPSNYPARQMLAAQLLREEKFEEAAVQLEQLKRLFDGDYSSSGPHAMLAVCGRELGQLDVEAGALQAIVDNTSDSLDSLRRLVEIRRDQADWEAVAELADQILAINPLITLGHTAARDAAIQLERSQDLVSPLRALQQMDPSDPALLHYQLATALVESDQLELARVEVLDALSHSPRYREAQVLLVTIHDALQSSQLPLTVQPPSAGLPPTPSAK
ncbi:MAG: tetratricopeptide repeat protein [Aureliella sp.]